MSWFARIEEACAAFIEQAFARTFPTDLEPAHIARKLVSTMEARTSHEGERAFAPSRYIVRVNPEDYARLKPHQLYLEEEWAALLADMAQRVSITLEPPLLVRLREDASVVSGAVEIDVTETAGGRPPEAAAPVRALHMRMVKGLPVDAVYALGPAVTIGRHRSNDVVIADPRISRQHARIETREGKATLTDLGSTNGTFLDGRRVHGTAPLRPGSVLTFGNTSLKVVEGPV